MDADGQRLLCIIVPCFNEEQVIEQTWAAIHHVVCDLVHVSTQIYFVDDGSTDTTLFKLNALARRDPDVRVISLSRNFGHQAAISAGLDLADRQADCVLVMDADLENPPALIPKMLDVLDHGHDVVMGVREAERAVPLWNRLASRAFYWIFNQLSDMPIKAAAPDFFLLSRRAREALSQMPEQRRFLRGMVAWIGFDRAYVHYVPPARAAGQSKYTFSRMLEFASDAVFAFSSLPLRLALRLGLLLSGLGTAGLLACALGFAIMHAYSPWTILAALITALAGLQISAVALVGGYVGRVFEESKARPLYLIKQAPDEQRRLDQPRIAPVTSTTITASAVRGARHLRTKN